MMRWAWAGAAALCGAPRALVAILMMFCVWAAVGEIVAAATLPHRGEFAAVMLCSFNAPFAAMLFANLLKLTRDVRELRLPRARHLLSASTVFLVGLMVVAPSLLAWTWHTGFLDVAIVAAAAIAGAAVGWLGTLRARARTQGRAWEKAGSSVRSRALRIALGPPYAPTSWLVRLTQVGLLCAALIASPMLVGVFGAPLSAPNFAIVLHVAEILGFLVAIVLCWIWPLSRVVILFNPERGGLSELALLPGFGERGLQLRQLCGIVMALPLAGLLALLVMAFGIALLAHLAQGAYLKLALEFLLIPMVTLPVLLSQIAQRKASSIWSVVFFMATQTLTLTMLLWTLSWERYAVQTLRWFIITFVLLTLTVAVAVSLHFLRRISARPHLFLDVSS